MIARTGLAWLVLTALTFAAADAGCRKGSLPSYDDISAVLLQQNGCGVGRSIAPVKHFPCSAFWALFSDESAVDAGKKPIAQAIYSQYNLVGSTGTYRLNSTLAKARAVLEKGGFFELSPPDLGPVVGGVTLTVKRCAVVTRIRASLMPETEGPIARILTGLLALIHDASKEQISPTPTSFSYDIFFER